MSGGLTPVPFSYGQRLTVRAGAPGSELVLPAYVLATAGNELVLELSATPLLRESVSPGACVHLEPVHEWTLPARAVVVEGGRGALLVVHAADGSGVGSPENRRLFFRVRMRLVPADVLARADGSAALLRVRLVDLSGGGAGLLTPSLPDTGRALALHVPLLAPHGLGHMPARIAWRRPAGRSWHIGLEFTELREAERDRIVGAVLSHEVRRGGRPRQ